MCISFVFCFRYRDAFQGTGPSLGVNPFQGALTFTKKRELSPGLPPASPDLLRYRTGGLAVPISATPDLGMGTRLPFDKGSHPPSLRTV